MTTETTKSEIVWNELPQVTVAAKWWADKLRGQAPKDNGDAFTSALANTLLPKTIITEEQLATFEAALKGSIGAKLATQADKWKPDEPMSGSYFRHIGCDYDPCPAIAIAAEVAGIPHRAFPWKTGMTINPDCVFVSAGYAAPWKSIWGVEPP